MCGRYVRKADKQKVAEWFHAEGNLSELSMPDADYNIAPTTQQPIIRQSKETGNREMILPAGALCHFSRKIFRRSRESLRSMLAQRPLRPRRHGENR